MCGHCATLLCELTLEAFGFLSGFPAAPFTPGNPKGSPGPGSP